MQAYKYCLEITEIVWLFFYVKSLIGEYYLYLESTKIITMKNFKKISRESLKSIRGGGVPEGICKPGYKYMCDAVGICGTEIDDACNCFCIKINPNVPDF